MVMHAGTKPSVIYYRDDVSFSPGDIIVVMEDSVADVLGFITLECLPRPRSIWSLSRNVRSDDVLLFLQYINCLENEASASIRTDNVSQAQSGFWSRWEHLLTALSAEHFNYSAAINSLAFLRSNLPTLLSGSSMLFDVLERHIQFVLSPLFCNGLFDFMTHSCSSSAWVFQPVPTLRSINHHISRFPTSSPKLVEATTGLKLIASGFQNLCLIYNESDIAEKLFMISAYYGMLAKRLLLANCSTTCLLAMHRSLDLYFQSLAYENDVISARCDNLQYKHIREAISLVPTVEQLRIHAGYSLDNASCNFIAELNTRRNQSMYTHSVYSCSLDYVQQTLPQVGNLITSVSGNVRWKRMAAQFSSFANIPRSLLFDSAASLDTYCASIPF